MTKRVSTTTDLQQHARALARAFNVRLYESPDIRPEQACAVPALRLVLLSPIVDETTYAVALHEIGHLCAALGALHAAVRDGNAVNLRRDEEDAAWLWARHYALDWTDAMEAVAQWAEGTYAAMSAPALPKSKTSRIDWSKYR
jgi:hypothetical protein